jgi:hypothetical protein
VLNKHLLNSSNHHNNSRKHKHRQLVVRKLQPILLLVPDAIRAVSADLPHPLARMQTLPITVVARRRQVVRRMAVPVVVLVVPVVRRPD